MGRFHLLCGLVSAGCLLAAPPAAAKGTLRAGAARVDITPAEGAALPLSGYGGRTEGFQGIHDRLFVRAIVADDGERRAAIVSWDLIGISHEGYLDLSARIARETGIPDGHVLIIPTHTHGAPDLRRFAKMEPGSPGRVYLDNLAAKTVDAVKQAQANLRPARIGYGAGRASVNMNRRARMPEGDWWLGNNPEGPSDKTVGVIRFETPDGKPFAFVINYAVHGTVLGPRNYQVTSDLPGAASRHVEEHFSDEAVAVFVPGASGDQDPIYRTGVDFGQREVLGRILGEEAIRTAAGIRTAPSMEIRGAQRVVTCPGKRQVGQSGRRKDGNYEFADGDPVDIRLSVLMLNHIAIAGVSGEVLTMIGRRVKEESPFAATLFTTHTNGASGYLPDDAAYDVVSYEIVTARVKRGCAEDSIVGGLLDLMDGL